MHDIFTRQGAIKSSKYWNSPVTVWVEVPDKMFLSDAFLTTFENYHSNNALNSQFFNKNFTHMSNIMFIPGIMRHSDYINSLRYSFYGSNRSNIRLKVEKVYLSFFNGVITIRAHFVTISSRKESQ